MSKKLRIEPVPASTLLRIAFEGGGEVPDALKGHFTTRTIAEAFIRDWAAANPDREVEVVPQKTEEPQKRGPGRPPKVSMSSI